jgi:tetratricopeptide (TPR) repeat protein
VRASADVRRGTTLSHLGRPEATRVLEEAIRLAEQTGNLDAAGRGLNNLGFRHLLAGDLEANLHYRQQALRVTERFNYAASIAWCHVMIGQALRYLGRIPEARAEVEQGLAIFSTIELNWQTTYGYLEMAEIAIDEGRFDDAMRLLDTARELAERNHDVQGSGYNREIQNQLDLLLDRPQEIITRFEGAEHPWEQELPGVAEAHLRTGAESRVEGLLATFLENDQLLTSAALRVRGMLHARRAEWEEAEADLLHALEHARRTHYRLEEGRALTEIGRTLAARGDRATASDRFAQALAVFHEMGAQAYVHQVEQAQLDLLRQ